MRAEELEPRFGGALRLRDAGELAKARAIMDELASEYPSRAEVWLMLGHLQWKQTGLPTALESFRRATALSPKMELASLGLFHALWEAGKRDEAFAEMRRFVELAGPSEEYGKVLEGLNR